MDMKTLRTRRGLTQTQVAALMGVTQPYIARYESGEHSLGNMTARNFLKLCEILNCTPDELLKED